MNQTSLIGRPLAAMTRSIVEFAEKRGVWSGPLTSSSPELARLWGTPTSSTGVPVDAYTYSVFWACVNNISTDIASFPLNLYKREKDGGKTLMMDHKLHQLLHDAPNPEMTAFTFRGLLTQEAATFMGFAEIVRDGAGQVAQLWPITSDRVQVKRYDRPPYAVYYEVSRADGRIDYLSKDDMFVLPGATVDGICGRHIMTMARESIGLGLAAERFGGTFYGNGSTFGGVFEHPGRMTEPAIKNFKESVNTQHQGVARAHKFIVVEEGMKFQRLTVDQNAAQFIETRQHQIEEMCRWFRMPPHKVQHLIRTSYNSVEQMNIEYSTDTLTPWCVRWEQEVLRQLIAPSERRIQFVKHNMDSKLRGDTASRYAAYTQGIQNGFLSADDVREKEDLNPLPNGSGKQYFIQSNTWPLDRVNEIIDQQVAPTPAPAAPSQAPAPADPNAGRQFAEALEQAIAASEARAADLSATIAGLEAALTTRTVTQEEAEVALRAQLVAEQSAMVSLKAQLVDVTERDARRAADQEVERLATAERQREADAAHTAALAVLQAAGEAEATRLQTERDALAAQAEQDRAVMAQTAVAADLTLTSLREELIAAEALHADTTQQLDAERATVEEAKAHLAQLQATIAETQAEVTRLAAERAEQATHATIAAEREAAAHLATDAATALLAQATANAEAARLRLADETARVETERAEKAELAALMETQRQTYADRLQALLPTRREQVIDTMSRQVRVEADRARRNQGTPAKLKAWAEAFYLQRDDQVLDALRPDMRAHLVFIGSTEDVDTYTRRLIAPQLLVAVTQIRTIADGDAEDYAASLERLLTKWELERPVAIADRVFQEEMTYVRSL